MPIISGLQGTLWTEGDATPEDMETFIRDGLDVWTTNPEINLIAAENVFDAYELWKARQEAMDRLYNLHAAADGEAWIAESIMYDIPDASGGGFTHTITLRRKTVVDMDELERYAKWLNLARVTPGTQLEFDFVWLELKGAGRGPDWVNALGDVTDERE